MEVKADLDNIYAPSEDIVAREIEEELLIVPLVSGIGDMEDELFTLNETGKVIWGHLDGEKPLKEVVAKLSEEFETPAGEIAEDIVGFVEELLRRGMLVEITNI
ncbi:PqqD family protein [Candidatus Poribacteria bacterium]